jgi:pilus assembly protein CpaF
LNDLVAAEMLTDAQARFLSDQICLGKNLLISGPTQAGKTTLLSALLNELPSQTRLISCEETFEIKCSLNDWVAMQTRQANLEGTGEIALRRLVKEALRMRPDRLVIGEVREAESFDLLIAMNSGLPGICTIHANSAQAALQKLCTLPLLAGSNITTDFITATLANSLDLVLQLGFEAGKRKVKEICTVHLEAGGLLAKAVKL